MILLIVVELVALLWVQLSILLVRQADVVLTGISSGRLGLCGGWFVRTSVAVAD